MTFNGLRPFLGVDLTSIKRRRSSLRFFIWDELPNQDFYVMHPSKFGSRSFVFSDLIYLM